MEFEKCSFGLLTAGEQDWAVLYQWYSTLLSQQPQILGFQLISETQRTFQTLRTNGEMNDCLLDEQKTGI
jgi:hypothetical protein